jgi:hypothetical protein
MASCMPARADLFVWFCAAIVFFMAAGYQAAGCLWESKLAEAVCALITYILPLEYGCKLLRLLYLLAYLMRGVH